MYTDDSTVYMDSGKGGLNREGGVACLGEEEYHIGMRFYIGRTYVNIQGMISISI